MLPTVRQMLRRTSSYKALLQRRFDFEGEAGHPAVVRSRLTGITKIFGRAIKATKIRAQICETLLTLWQTRQLRSEENVIVGRPASTTDRSVCIGEQ